MELVADDELEATDDPLDDDAPPVEDVVLDAPPPPVDALLSLEEAGLPDEEVGAPVVELAPAPPVEPEEGEVVFDVEVEVDAPPAPPGPLVSW